MHQTSTNSVVLWLTIAHVITRQSQGILNSVAYGYNYAIRKEISRNLKKCWGKHDVEDEGKMVNMSLQEVQKAVKLLSN